MQTSTSNIMSRRVVPKPILSLVEGANTAVRTLFCDTLVSHEPLQCLAGLGSTRWHTGVFT
jgi:hypothetical protein